MDNELFGELLQKNFAMAGYRVMVISEPLRPNEKIIMPFTVTGSAAQAFVFVNYQTGMEWTRESYDELTRKIKSLFYDKGYEKVELFHIICTRQGQKAKDIAPAFDSYWIIDTSLGKLMVYENQKDDFMARQVIERTLRGESFEKKKVSFIPFVTLGLVLINVMIYIIMHWTGVSFTADDLIQWGAAGRTEIIEQHQYYRLFTCMFLHFSASHVFSNMLSLGVMGVYLEKAIGRVRFLLLYLTSGIAASVVSLTYYVITQQNVVSAGASGAVFGVIGGILAMVICDRRIIRDISIPRMILFVGLSLFSGFGDGSIDNAAHVGGFLFGLVAMIGVNIIEQLRTGKAGNANEG